MANDNVSGREAAAGEEGKMGGASLGASVVSQAVQPPVVSPEWRWGGQLVF
jgi:hypothetical protein